MKVSIDKSKQMNTCQLVEGNEQKQFSLLKQEQTTNSKFSFEIQSDEYQIVKRLRINSQQNYPTLLNSDNQKQKRLLDVIPIQQSPKSIYHSSKNSPKRLGLSISKSFKQNLSTEIASPITRHSSLSNVIIIENSKIEDKFQQSTSSPFSQSIVRLKTTSMKQNQTPKSFQINNQTNQIMQYKGMNEKNENKQVKTREKRIISTKSVKSIMITTNQQNTISSLYVTPLFKVQFVVICKICISSIFYIKFLEKGFKFDFLLLKYIVENGNNSQIVKNVLNKRGWWAEAQNQYSTYHFKWKPTSSGIKFDDIVYTPSKKQMVNHIENHIEISCKSKLYKNFKSFKKNEVDKFMPKTFLLNIESETYEKDIQSFVESFLTFKQDSKLKNIWILKPDDLNRGQGISLFNTLSQLYRLLMQFGRTETLKKLFSKICPQALEKYKLYQKQKEDKEREKEQLGDVLDKSQKKTRQQVSNLNSTPKIVIIQKYVENPLLIQNRKFDIRVWVLVDQDFKFYMFKEGYLRLSSEPFSLRSHKLSDKYIHLTNNAIQKYGKNYGKFENGNIISYTDYNDYLESKNYPFTLADSLTQIKSLIKMSFNCTKSKLFKKERRNTFEIFGYDFLVENDGNTYLIEINSNPCIEESNQHLAKIIPRMLSNISIY